MDDRRIARRLAALVAAIAGALAGAGLAGLTEAGTAQQTDTHSTPWIEATHLPPLLTTANEPVELRFDAYCVADEDVDAPCDVDVEVYARQGNGGPFRTLPVREAGGSEEGRFVATVPASLARVPAGFAYYAVLRDRHTGATTTLPAGGAAAPQSSRPLVDPVDVSIGAHRFGVRREADARVVSAPWGSGPGEVGLEQGRNVMPMGGSSFDVTADSVHVLDEANRRILRWRRGAKTAEAVPVAVNGTLADLGVREDGTMYVLETTAEHGEPAIVRAFDPRGRAIAETPGAERGSQLRLGPGGDVLVLQHPSGQWMTAFRSGRPTIQAAQKLTGRTGQPLADGGELVVLRRNDEIRVAVADRGGVRQGWRITSATPLAEVQLADVVAGRLLVVVRAYSDGEDEFRVLLLGPRGLVDSFSVASSDWAETAPLSRFRVRGSSLYQLGSTPDGLFVDRFDLEVD